MDTAIITFLGPGTSLRTSLQREERRRKREEEAREGRIVFSCFGGASSCPKAYFATWRW